MTPEVARRLSRAYDYLSTITTGVAGVVGVAGVAAVAHYASKTQQLRPLRPLRAKKVKGEKAEGEGVAASLDSVADAIEERKALIAECCLAPYVDAFARLNHQKPFAVSTEEWQRAVHDAGLFLDNWGELATQLGWTAGDLFDVPDRDRRGGLIWPLRGERVEALGPDHARLSDERIFDVRD